MTYYVHIALSGGFEIEAENDEDAEEKVRLFSLMDLVEKTERPVWSLKIGRQTGLFSSQKCSKTNIDGAKVNYLLTNQKRGASNEGCIPCRSIPGMGSVPHKTEY